jgi:type IV pilus assembly protein PilE
MNIRRRSVREAGITLIELMIVVAILAIISAIAIPAYQGHVREARLGTARANIDPLRLALEDYWLDNGTYADANGAEWDPTDGTETLKTGSLKWKPEGDEDKVIYAVDASVNSYTITVNHVDLPTAADAVIYHRD